MKKTVKLAAILLICLFCAGCAATTTVKTPPGFSYVQIEAGDFTLASWQKITEPLSPVNVYIEGDGYAFTAKGQPTANPTPKSDFTRRMAFADPAPNVVYLARPCQFVTGANCNKLYWTTGRFAPVVVKSMYAAVRQIAGNSPVTLIGFSGGAQIAGLLAVSTNLNVVMLVTVAGNLNHPAWTARHNLTPLKDSLSLTNYREAYLALPQVHFVGERDKVVPPDITQKFVNGRWPVHIVPNATHNKGFETAWPQIFAARPMAP